jgi:CDP-paratose 2-epimerase
MKILITGVCGFVGSSIAELLLERLEGVQIVGVDNFIRPGSETNRCRLERVGVKFLHGDLRQASDISDLPACDWVIDAAANPSVLAGLSGAQSSRRLFEHNLAAFGNILDYCRVNNAGLLLLSSSRAYSISALSAIPLRVKERAFEIDSDMAMPRGLTVNGIGVEFSTEAPVSLYGATKLASECLALEYGYAFNFPVWITRCGVLAGAGQFGTAAQGIFAFWINSHLRRKPIRYIGFDGTGYQTRDALHPHDLANLLIKQIQSTRSRGQRIYTAGGGPANCMSLAQLTAWCNDRFGIHGPTVDPNPRPYDIPWVAMDSTAAATDFDWNIGVRLPMILEEIALHALRHPDWMDVSNA